MRCAAPESDHVPGRLRRGLCERHYRRLMKTGSTAPPVLVDDLNRYTVDPSGCWLWDGPLYSNGYGKLARPLHGTRLAHRAFYLASGRESPDGMDLDHLCRVRQCVNPDHLEPVSRSVNLRRGLRARKTCRRGHDLTDPANLKPGTNECILCWRIRYKAAGARYRARRRALAPVERCLDLLVQDLCFRVIPGTAKLPGGWACIAYQGDVALTAQARERAHADGISRRGCNF